MKQLSILAAGVLCLLAFACSDDDDAIVTPATTGSVTVSLDHFVDASPLLFNVLGYTNSTGTVYSVSRLQYLISNVTLHSTDGKAYGVTGAHFRDHADATTQTLTIAGVPNGTYDRVSFTFGLDAVDNVKDAYLNESWHGAMEWPGPLGSDQGLGYHYMKLEGNYEDTPGGSTSGYTTHTGARWCNGPCGPAGTVVDPTPMHHYFRVSLPVTATTIEGDALQLSIRFDINKWYTDPTPTDAFDSEYDWHNLAGQMIMANLAAQDMLQANGPSCFSAEWGP